MRTIFILSICLLMGCAQQFKYVCTERKLAPEWAHPKDGLPGNPYFQQDVVSEFTCQKVPKNPGIKGGDGAGGTY